MEKHLTEGITNQQNQWKSWSISSGINPVTGADTYLSAGCDIQDAGSYTSQWCDLLFHVEWSFLFHGPLKMASHCDLVLSGPWKSANFRCQTNYFWHLSETCLEIMKYWIIGSLFCKICVAMISDSLRKPQSFCFSCSIDPLDLLFVQKVRAIFLRGPWCLPNCYPAPELGSAFGGLN